MKKIIFLAAFLMLAVSAVSIPGNAETKSDIEVAFSPNQGATETIIGFINSAKTSIRVAAYSFTSADIAQALLSAHHRGIDVRVVLDKSNQTGKYSSATFLANKKVPLRINSRYKIMHSKYIIVDSVSVETGSFNYTKAAENGNAENVIILHNNPSVAEKYTRNWQSLWDESNAFERE